TRQRSRLAHGGSGQQAGRGLFEADSTLPPPKSGSRPPMTTALQAASDRDTQGGKSSPIGPSIWASQTQTHSFFPPRIIEPTTGPTQSDHIVRLNHKESQGTIWRRT